MNKANKHFQGSVDDLLTHIDTVDISTIDNDIAVENAIQKIMKDTGESHENIWAALMEAHMEEVKEAIDNLMTHGLVAISGYNDEGEAIYVSTLKN
jgi:hypothetical protein